MVVVGFSKETVVIVQVFIKIEFSQMKRCFVRWPVVTVEMMNEGQTDVMTPTPLATHPQQQPCDLLAAVQAHAAVQHLNGTLTTVTSTSTVKPQHQ